MILFFPYTAKGWDQQEIFQAFANEQQDSWKKIIDEDDQDINLKLELLYGYIGWCIHEKDMAQAQEYLTELYQCSQQEGISENTRNLYLSIADSYSIIVEKQSKLKKGRQAYRHFKDIDKPDENLFVVYKIHQANLLRNIPRLLGGSKKKAISIYQEVLAHLNQQANADHNWLYVLTLYFLYETTKSSDPEQSAQYREKILQLCPNFTWI